MITITNITYRIGSRTLLDNANLTVMDGWKIGIVGANGVGKTTLFKIIEGILEPDTGSVEISSNQRMGIIRQDMPETEKPLLDVVLETDDIRQELLNRSETATDPYEISDIYEKLNDIDAYSAPSKAATILSGLGFSEEDMQQPFSSFSGGWRMRAALAGALFIEPEILLLDEPTNHLDLEAIIWLENYLKSYPHSLVVISHDRDLLNKCTDHIAHLENQIINLYTGNYDTFERERAERLGMQQKAFEKQQEQVAHMQSYIDRFRYKASKAKQAQSRIKSLERMDLVDAVIADRATKFTFPNPDKLAPPILAIDHADVGYTEGNPILTNIHERIDMDDRIALLGANGNGKSTLIKLIAGKLLPMVGEVRNSAKLKIGYFSQHQTEELDMNSTPYIEMRHLMGDGATEPKVRAKLGAFGFSKNLADNKIDELSGGEKARLLFAFMSYHAPHILLLDEPTNHLDIDAREGLVQALNNYEGAVIIVSHDPYMVERVADELWMVNAGKVSRFDGDLDDYKNFIIDNKRKSKKKDGKSKPAKIEAKPAQIEESYDERKARKKEAAEKRKSLAPLSKKVSTLEKQLNHLLARKVKIEDIMGDSEFYNDNDKVKDTQFEYGQLLKEISDTESEWLNSQEEYEKAKA